MKQYIVVKTILGAPVNTLLTLDPVSKLYADASQKHVFLPVQVEKQPEFKPYVPLTHTLAGKVVFPDSKTKVPYLVGELSLLGKTVYGKAKILPGYNGPTERSIDLGKAIAVDVFWYVTSLGTPAQMIATSVVKIEKATALKDLGNYFETKEQASLAAQKIKALFTEY